MKRRLCLTLALALLAMVLPVHALAAKPAKPSIGIGVKVGFLPVGGSVKLRPKLTGVSRSSLRYSSSDSAVAAISDTGRINALSAGRAIITVSGGGVKARCGVVVLPTSVTVKEGERFSLPNGTVEKYAVKDKRIASISKSGVITGKKAGNTLVALKYGSRIMTIKVEVTGSSTGGTDPYAYDSKVEGLKAATQTSQIVLVEYSSGSNATLSVHEKKSGVWRQLFETKAYVGKNGIGKTREGDKKTPTGTYNLTTPFGILSDPGANMPYTKVTKYHYWCGASSSKYYNQLCDSRVNGRNCTSSDEHLIDYKGAYNYCMFIDYNAAGVAKKGSCIFLHCFSKNKYTAGCVAVSEASMKKIIQWARSGVKIVVR